MRILLDECLPLRLKDELPDHDVRTVPEAGWKGLKNGELLALAAGQFDVFITIDAGIAYQQNMESLSLGVIALKARSNRLQDLRPLMAGVRNALGTVGPGRWVQIGG